MNVSRMIRVGALVTLIASLGAPLTACGPKPQTTRAFFVGKWSSSKLATPLVLSDNGEWEIKKDDGGVLQYGLWEYRDGNIIWSYKRGNEVVNEVNPVVHAKDREFRLKEGALVTVFQRLD